MTDKAAPRATCRSTASPPTTARCRRCCSARQRRRRGGPRGHRAGARRHRRASRSAPISCAASRRARRCGSAIRAGRTIARCSKAPASPSTPIAYYDAATRGLDFDGDDRRAASRCPRARSSCCTRAATTRPASIRRAAQWAADHRDRPRARPRAVPRHRLPGLRATASTPTAPSCARSPPRPARCSSRARSRSRSRSTASASARCRSSPPTRTRPRACCRR